MSGEDPQFQTPKDSSKPAVQDEESSEELPLPDEKIVELLSKVPEDIRLEVQTLIRDFSFSGPIPPPQFLERYEKILPGSADRIVTMAENEQKNAKEVGHLVLSNDRFRIGGSILVSLALIAGACFCAYLGQPLLGGVLGVSGIVPVFIRIIESLRRP